MPLNFRKRIKIAPGVKLNLSKSGISANVGVRGANVGIGERGTHANVGIPGSGISYRQRLDSPGRSVARPTRRIVRSGKSLFLAYALWLVLGLLGAHRFYLRRTVTGLIMLALTAASIAFAPLLLVSGGWWLVDAFLIPRMR